ncbi:MAG: hypothetical protein AB7S78_02635 [Candidatus Omnitrophota bacterium]
MRKVFLLTFLTLLLLINTRAQALMMLETGAGSEDAFPATLQSADLDRSFADEHSILSDIQGWVTTHTVSMIYLSVLSEGTEPSGMIIQPVPENFLIPLEALAPRGFAPSIGSLPDWYGIHDIQWVLNNWAPRPAETNTPKS